jgi:hypothetical protein
MDKQKREKKRDKEKMIDKKEEEIPKSSHIMEGKYAVLMETSGNEFESWYYFIRTEGNMEALQHLQKQLEQIEWYILDDLSTFDLELEYPVSAQTAKEMTKIDMNAYSFHRKFDGKLKTIDFGFRRKDNNDTKIGKVFDVLGYGQIEDFIDDEDIDPEDLVTDSESESESDSDSDRDSSDTESSSSSDEEERRRRQEKYKKKKEKKKAKEKQKKEKEKEQENKNVDLSNLPPSLQQ